MFSNTAYEALYQYLGLELHSKFVEVITSQKVFLGMIVMIFGVMFFLTTAQFFSRYIPGAIITRRHVPLSRFFKIVALLFLGISLLKVGSSTGVKRFSGESWHSNPYVHGRAREVASQYRVSLVFDLMSRSAEEISALISRVVDSLFQTTNSQLEAPNFFFKAIMYGAATTIEDPELKRSIRTYTDECFDRILPMIRERAAENKLDGFFADKRGFDEKLSELVVDGGKENTPYTCLDLKTDLRTRLKSYALSRPGLGKNLGTYLQNNSGLSDANWENYQVSSLLVNEYTGQHEGFVGVQKGSQLPSTGGRIIQYIHRIGFDGLISLFGGGKYSGAWVAASRSQEFSENLARAPHVAGFIKMLLIAVFPWLLFFVVAGYWRVLISWWLMYFSVLLWTPIWTLLYHVMTSIALSSEIMEAFGKLNGDVSLYSAQLISSRIYHLYAVYSWLQLLTGTVFTGLLLYFIRPALTDTESDSAPEALDGAGKMAGQATKAVGAFV